MAPTITYTHTRATPLAPCLRLGLIATTTCPCLLQVTEAAQQLIQRGARSVLVTLADRGSLLLGDGGELLLRQPPLPVPGGVVVDGTAAGEFREGSAQGHILAWWYKTGTLSPAWLVSAGTSELCIL